MRRLAAKTGIPVTTTVMGLGAFPANDPLFLGMFGMHGTVYANYAVADADLLIALGVRFDDRVTGKFEEFAKHAKIIHVDIDASEINKNKEAHLPIVADVKQVLQELNKIVEPPEDISDWITQCDAWKKSDPLKYDAELRRDPAAVRDRQAVRADERPRPLRDGGRRPASDVGRSVLQIQ